MNKEEKKTHKRNQFIGDIFLHIGEFGLAIFSIKYPFGLIILFILIILEVWQNKYIWNKILN